MRNNFILLDGITLYVFLGIVFLYFFCGLVIVACSINQDKQMKKLQKENEKLDSKCRMMKHQLGRKNSLINFLRFRISELEEEISIRDEAIAEALKNEVKDNELQSQMMGCEGGSNGFHTACIMAGNDG